MKHKIRNIVALICVLGVAIIFVSCGKETIKTTDTGKVTEASFLSSISKVNNAKVYFTNNNLEIDLEYIGNNSESILNEFKKNVSSIMDEPSIFSKYNEIKSIKFYLNFKDQNTYNSIEYKLEDNKFIKCNEEISIEGLNNFVENKPIKTDDTNSLPNTKPTIDNNKFIETPASGEFKIDNDKLKTLTFSMNNLEYSKFEIEDGVVDVDLLYSNELTKGVVIQIQKNIKNMFGNKEIELDLNQKHPLGRFEFKYINGQWQEK